MFMLLQASWKQGDLMPAKENSLIIICWLHMCRLAQNLVPFMDYDIQSLNCWCRNIFRPYIWFTSMWLQATWCLSWENCSFYMQRKAGAFPGRLHAFHRRLHSLPFADFHTTQYVSITVYNTDTNIMYICSTLIYIDPIKRMNICFLGYRYRYA